MKRLLGLLCCVLALGAGVLPGALAATENTPPVVLGVLAFRPKAETLARWQPLVDYLNQQALGRRFVLDALAYPELEAAVHERSVGVVLTQPAHYILLAHQAGLYSPLATLIERDHGQVLSEFGGVIVVPAARSELQSLADLRGRRIAVSRKASLGGYLAQARELKGIGIDPARDLQVLEFGMPHDRALREMLAGQADAAFVRTGVLEAMQQEGQLDPVQIRVLKIPGVP